MSFLRQFLKQETRSSIEPTTTFERENFALFTVFNWILGKKKFYSYDILSTLATTEFFKLATD